MDPQLLVAILTLLATAFPIFAAITARLSRTIKRLKDKARKQDEVIKELVVFSMSSEAYKHLWHIHHGRLQVERREPGSEYLEYLYHDNEQMHREMYFLKDHGYLQPVSGGDLYFSNNIDGVNLVDIVKPSAIGSFYVDLRKEYEENVLHEST